MRFDFPGQIFGGAHAAGERADFSFIKLICDNYTNINERIAILTKCGIKTLYSCENFTNMIARFIIKNLFSFDEQTEFNLFPGRASRLKHHKYARKEVEMLKLSALYG